MWGGGEWGVTKLLERDDRKREIKKREGRTKRDRGWQGVKDREGEVMSPSSNLVLLSRGSSRAHIPLGSKY